MRGCGIDREGVVHYQNTDAEDCGHLQVTAECRLAPFKECTESMFLSAIIDSAILRTLKIIRCRQDFQEKSVGLDLAGRKLV
jgi:hypothetical protein